MKRTAFYAFFGILALTTVWFLGRLPPFHREQLPGVLLGDILAGSPFVAQIDGVRYGSATRLSETPYDYVIIFLKMTNGTKIGVIDYKPNLHTIELVRSLKEGTTYTFPEVLSKARPETKENY